VKTNDEDRNINKSKRNVQMHQTIKYLTSDQSDKIDKLQEGSIVLPIQG
jgi:hypothetical protein